MQSHLPKSTKLIAKRQLADNMFALTLDISVGARPGQFVMVWDGTVDELPISVAEDDGTQLHVLVGAVGDGSRAICAKQVGDYVGVRGPYGRGFPLPESRIKNQESSMVMVAGGYGVAPLYFFAKNIRVAQPDATIDFILGARSKDLLLDVDKLQALGVQLHLTTNDGSAGTKGFTTDVLAKLLVPGGAQHVYTVGPELMMKKVADLCLAAGVVCHVSIERFMKCGFGVCGACCVDKTGERMCVEGPVVDARHLDQIPEFGSYHRNSAAEKVNY